jgi:hypothetical protein
MKQNSVSGKFSKEFFVKTGIIFFGINRVATIEEVIIPEIVTSKVIVIKFDEALRVWVFF